MQKIKITKRLLKSYAKKSLANFPKLVSSRMNKPFNVGLVYGGTIIAGIFVIWADSPEEAVSIVEGKDFVLKHTPGEVVRGTVYRLRSSNKTKTYWHKKLRDEAVSWESTGEPVESKVNLFRSRIFAPEDLYEVKILPIKKKEL